MNRHCLALMALMSFVAPTVAWADQNGQHYGPHMWGDGWHGWFFGPVMMILFLAVAVGVVVLLVRWIGAPGHGVTHHHPPSKAPLDILKERFARGEIDKEDFEERRRVLGE